ncbi:transferrin receptor 1b [Gouania willdenowi]|uniref:Transferrin receptor protein 1-like n=1 Tax=Gouania willdenowi TaxID=441366 RepID=A0A8C5HG83_GOUWI|nr:transferrin receptor protein 1-like [Gouania willdenowi]
MERINQMFHGVMNSERYSRFSLQPTEDGEGHAEVQLAEDSTEAEDGGSPTFRPVMLRHSRRFIMMVVLGVLIAFLIGCTVGLLRPSTAGCTTAAQAEEATQQPEPAAAAAAPNVQHDWNSLTTLLEQKLTSKGLEEALQKYNVPNRSAGGEEDKKQAESIYDTFRSLEMDPWTDIHYVQLQTTDSVNKNRVTFGSEEFQPKGYLAYSATGKVQGKLVYGNYGSKKDLDTVQRKNVELKNSVLLLRAGNMSFAEQVDSASSRGVSAVLIYPDESDYDFRTDTELYGHVHMGFGDPYTPGFPSFNHTQFPPAKSSGLPTIPAQTITGNMAKALLSNMTGPEPDPDFKGQFKSSYKLGGTENVTVEVNNVLVNTEIHNVFGVIKGFIEPDHYVVLGAQRDAWGRGYTKANVGTSILMELAETFKTMVEKDDFRPRRSLVFASWSAGEFGNVGATEWLEAHMTSIGKSVVSYISLDGAVMGRGGFMASASPLLYTLLKNTMKEVQSPFSSGTLYEGAGSDWESAVLRPMKMEDPAYPFLAFSGIPSVSFHFISPNKEFYTYYNTDLDNMEHLQFQTDQSVAQMASVAAQFAARMSLRLIHDHLLSFDVSRYKGVITKAVVQVYRRVNQLSVSSRLKGVGPHWLNRARGSFSRAADSINNDIINSDMNDREGCRLINQRLMTIERSLLSPYTSPIDAPLRHLLFGHGRHTLSSIATTEDMEDLHLQLALATWSLQGCANAMVGNIWDLDNEI